MRILSLLILLALCLLSCNKPKKHKPIWSDTPCGRMDVSWTENPLQVMQISFENKKTLLRYLKTDSMGVMVFNGYLDSLISYSENNSEKYIPYVFINPVDSSLKKLCISTGSLMMYSWGYSEIKNYMIHWPNGVTDTLFCDFRKDNTRNNSCCCQYPLISMTLNGKSFTRKTDDFRYGTYLFDK